MADLPANQKTGSKHLSPERRNHREWIAGRAITLLSHYWRDDDPLALTAAMGADWADVLEGIPQQYIQTACIVYQRDEPRRKPTPGAIYQLARKIMPAPKVVMKPPEPERKRCSPEMAKEILNAANIRVKRFENDEA